MTDAKPPGHLRPARIEQVAGGTGTGRDTTGGGRHGAATGVGTAGAKTAGKRPGGAHARLNPAAELGFSGDPGQHGDSGDEILHAQRVWDGALATSRVDELGLNIERQRLETKDITASVGLLIDGWPEDVRMCVQSVLDHTGAKMLAIDLGNVDGTGNVIQELADTHPDRITLWRVAEKPHWRGGTATWGECRTKLLRLDDSDVHVLMETYVVLSGDALIPLLAAVAEGAVAAGWHGVTLPDDGTYWREAGPGRVRALTGEFMAVRRSAALGALPEHANYGGNADLALSLGLRGELVVPAGRLPLRRLGPHDVPGDYRDRESRRNFDGVLRMLSA
ncbi:hypothetical protein ITP53_09865 [Nonomuraea sp. K274]|uniref:Glycosyl transferase family 2 n=1 Tax=Nonomuraea cypriaca TaxID=1187855 RepID=A0A931A6S0_9ACTN|nr:hypothetical protein [Nonomuraea cypriaca]MBF8186045.1 hypothetical protein [Nonomuraea cypriaca]